MKQDWEQVSTNRFAFGHLPTYFLFLKTWCIPFDVSKLAIRLPSVLAGAISASLVTGLSSKWLPQRAAIFAGILIALNGIGIEVSQSARMYSINGMLEILFFFSLLNLLTQSTRRYWIIYFVVVLLGCLSHLLFIRLAAVAFLVVLYFRVTKFAKVPSSRRTMFLLILPFACCLLLIFAGQQYNGRTADSRIAYFETLETELNTDSPSPPPLPVPKKPPASDMLQEQMPQSHIEFARLLNLPMGRYELVIADNNNVLSCFVGSLILITTIGLIFVAFKGVRPQATNPPDDHLPQLLQGALLIWCVTPCVINILLGFIKPAPVLMESYVFGSTFGVNILMAYGLWRISYLLHAYRRVLLEGILCLAFVFIAGATLLHKGEGQKQCLQVWQKANANEKIYFMHAGYWLTSFEAEKVAIPPQEMIGGTALPLLKPSNVAKRLEQFAGNSDTFWLFHFYSLPPTQLAELLHQMNDNWNTDTVHSYEDSSLYLFSRK